MWGSIMLKVVIGVVVVFLSFPMWSHAQIMHGGGGGSGRVTVTETDGSPSISARTLQFTNGTVTDAGNGVAAVTISGTGSPIDAVVLTTSVLLPNGTDVPGTCSVGMLYFDNDASAGVNNPEPIYHKR